MGRSKPAPNLFLSALEAVGCAPEEACMVGDRIDNDIRPAKKLGMNEYRAKLYAGGVKNIDADALSDAYLEAYDCLVSLHSTAFEPYTQMRTLLCRILPSLRG